MKGPVLLLAPFLCLGGGPAGAEDPEPKEITIHLRGNTTGAAALLDAAAKGTTVTGIADFDSLAALYGLMGIYREGTAPSSSFYGHRFRLRFPPDANVIGIAEGYGNLPGIEAARFEKPVYLSDRIRGLGGSKHAEVRVLTKVVSGTGSYVAFTGIGAILYNIYLYDDEPEEPGVDDTFGGMEAFFIGMMVGGTVGFPLGVTAVDPYDSLPATLLAGVIPATVGVILLRFGLDHPMLGLTGLSLVYVIPQFSALMVSEGWRKPSEDRRTSFGIAPSPKGGLSAVATLRF